MNLTQPFLVAVAAAALLAGCATQTKEQLAAVRAARVSSATLQKLEHRGVLTPADLIELKRRKVDDAVALRQLDQVGVDYVLHRRDLQMLRDNGVSKPVIRAVVEASGRFSAQFYAPVTGYGFGWGPSLGYPYDPFYYSPWWSYGSFGYSYGRYRRY